MFWTLSTIVINFLTRAQAGPVPPSPYPSPSLSPLPISVLTTTLLGNVRSLSTHVNRDLGFQGRIDSHIMLVYGDTLYSDGSYSETWRGMTSDSMAYATHNPLEVLDVDLNSQGFPKQFCPLEAQYGEDPGQDAMGITNVVQTGPGKGILYFLKNHRPNGINNLIGAGLATITLSNNTYPPVPTVQRLSEYWWDGAVDPWYGDVGAVAAREYIYAYGHARDTPYVYVARVKIVEATRLECYEYWNGSGWQPEKLRGFGEKEGVFWQVNQGQVVWSNHLRCFIFVYCDNWMNNKVLAKTASRPEGPWSDAVTLYQATPATNGSSIYAAVPHPYYDESGKSLVVTFTNHPNLIQAVNITFA